MAPCFKIVYQKCRPGHYLQQRIRYTTKSCPGSRLSTANATAQSTPTLNMLNEIHVLEEADRIRIHGLMWRLAGAQWW